MKKVLLLLFVALVAGTVSFGLYYQSRRAAIDSLDELSWLKQEFRLDERQFSAIERLHADYAPVCLAHCSEYVQAQRTLARVLERSPAPTAELDRTLTDVYRIQADCESGMLRHGYDVAAVMSPDQGARYLAMVKAQVLGVVPPAMRGDSR